MLGRQRGGGLGGCLVVRLGRRGAWRMEDAAGVVAAVSVPVGCKARPAADALVAADAVQKGDGPHAGHHGGDWVLLAGLGVGSVRCVS